MDPAPTYVGAKSSKPAPTGEVAAQGVEVQPVRHKWRRAPRGGTARARHRAGSAPRGLGTARARRRSGTAKGSAPQKGAAQEWQHRKDVGPQGRGAPCERRRWGAGRRTPPQARRSREPPTTAWTQPPRGSWVQPSNAQERNAYGEVTTAGTPEAQRASTR